MTPATIHAYIERIAQVDAQETSGNITTRQINTLARTNLNKHNVNCAPSGRISGKDATAFVKQYAAAFLRLLAQQ